MNYFAHAYQHLDAPCVAVGTAVPDLLTVCGRRLRRANLVVREHAEPAASQLVRGILQHFDDDDAFHASPAFTKVWAETTRSIRLRYPERPRLRASFLGHVLTEMLLDACLIERDPDELDAYYSAVRDTDSGWVQQVVNGLLPVPTDRLAPCLERFLEHRFLADYLDDPGLLTRLTQVVRRVGLPELPEDFGCLLPSCRDRVRASVGELLEWKSVPGS